MYTSSFKCTCLTFIEDVFALLTGTRQMAYKSAICCVPVFGAKQGRWHICHKCQSSQPVVLAATSTICPFVTGMPSVCFYSFAPHHQRNVTGLVRKRHSLTLWQQSCYGVSERLFTEAKHEKTVHLGHKLPRLTLRQI